MLRGINCCRVPSPALQGQLLVWDVGFSPSPPISPSSSGGDTERRGGINAAVATDVNAIFKGKTVSTLFRTAENFRGRKLLRISRFCGYTQNFFCKLWGVVSFGKAKVCNPRKFSLRKIVFSPIRESFLCENCIFTNSRKFSPSKVSRYMVCTVLSSSSYTFTYMHMHTFFPNTHNPCSFTAWSTACHGGRDQQEDTQGRHRNRRGVL